MADPTIARLNDRVTSLERRLEKFSGVGVSQQGQALNVRTMQPGFAGVLTSMYDGAHTPSQGYSWARLYLDTTVPGLVTPGVQPVGNLAFALDGDTTLQPGPSPFWFEPSPDASGYLFSPLGGGGGGVPAPPQPGTPCSFGCGWLAGCTYNDCFLVTVVEASGAMLGIDTTQTLILSWNGTGWASTTPFNTCLSCGTLLLDPGDDFGGYPRLAIEGLGGCDCAGITPSGSGSGASLMATPPTSGGGSCGFEGTYYLTPACCDPAKHVLYFSGGNRGVDAICCAEEVVGDDNVFTLSVQRLPGCQGGLTDFTGNCLWGTAACVLPYAITLNLTSMTAGGIDTSWLTGAKITLYYAATSDPSFVGYRGTATLAGGTVSAYLGCFPVFDPALNPYLLVSFVGNDGSTGAAGINGTPFWGPNDFCTDVQRPGGTGNFAGVGTAQLGSLVITCENIGNFSYSAPALLPAPPSCASGSGGSSGGGGTTPTGGCPELTTGSILSWTGSDGAFSPFSGMMGWDPTYPRRPAGTGFGAYVVTNPASSSVWALWWTGTQFVCFYQDGQSPATNFLAAFSFSCNPFSAMFAFGTATGP